MKPIHMTIKVNQTKLPNKMHFEVQKNTRAQVFKAKKGKGSYNRKNFKKESYCF